MFANYFKTALRNILRHRVHALINFVGLAAAMAAAILILLFVVDDLRFDTFHRHADRIFRVIRTIQSGASALAVALNPEPLAAGLKNDLPEVEDAVSFTGTSRSQVRYAGRWARDVIVNYTDPAFFRIFSFEIIRSSGEPLLEDPHSAVLTQNVSHKIFADEDPIGKTIFLPRIGEVRVAAIIESPRRTHIPLGVILPMDRYPNPGYVNNWKNSNFTTYVLLREGADPEEFHRKHHRYLQKYDLPDFKLEISLQPLTRIFLHSDFAYDFLEAPYDIRLDYLLLAVVIGILVISVLNYINIETARSTRRAGETALRKTLGASRSQLVAQFLCEAVLLCFFAFLVAVCLVEVALPPFTQWVEMEVKNLKLFNPENRLILFSMAGVVVFIGAAAGIYPAILLSSFKPTTVLKRSAGAAAPATLRKFLVVSQFGVSILLVIATLTISHQLNYMRTRHPGYTPDNLICVPLSEAVKERFADFKTMLLPNPNITRVTAARDMPVWEGPATLLTDWEGRTDAEGLITRYGVVDPDFIETMQIQLTEGISFSGDAHRTGWIVNREAVRQMGLDEPVGKWIAAWEIKRPVIGVVEDYNYTNMREKVEPLLLLADKPELLNFVFIRVLPLDVEKTLSFIQNVWQQLESDIPFYHQFLSERLDKMYTAEEKVGELFAVSSLLALMLSCLGLYGLTSFLCEQRTKEIAVRKAHGASSWAILRSMLIDYFKPVLIANLIAWPVAYESLDYWLKDFAYRIKLTAGPFVTAGAISIVVVLLAVGLKALRTASANPVDALRYE